MDKEYILSEIRRTAIANGGAALGRSTFYKETGIRESDWSGRYWVRWGDAVREAGFEPNSLQKAYDESKLIEQLIGLIRELGHFPVIAELRMQARAADFPSHNSIRRLGNKLQLAARIQEYCKSRVGYEDVTAICNVVQAPSPAPSRNGDDSEENFGFVYLIRSGQYYKLGRSNAVGRREREIAIQLPEKANTIHSIRTDDPAGIEAYWHERFESKRKNGEWFELSPVEIKAFKRRKFM